MAACAFAIPGDIATPTGGYGYDRRVLALLPRFGVSARHLQLPGGFPFPDAAALAATKAALAGVPADETLLIDGLAFGALPLDVVDAARGPIVALVHHPLAHEPGAPADKIAALRASETAALKRARAVIVTSEPTRRLMLSDYEVPAEKLVVAEPGVEAAARAAGSNDPTRPHLLAVGAVSPRKSYPMLVQALATLKDLPWRLTIAGAVDRAPAAAAALDGAIAASGLQDRITLAGAVDDATLAHLYHRADLFLMPSSFEGYGMVVTEALARGLPLVSTTGGALAEVAPDSAALKVPPDDAAAFAAAVRRMLTEPGLRAAKADAAWALAGRLPRWEDTTATIAGVLKGI